MGEIKEEPCIYSPSYFFSQEEHGLQCTWVWVENRRKAEFILKAIYVQQSAHKIEKATRLGYPKYMATS